MNLLEITETTKNNTIVFLITIKITIHFKWLMLQHIKDKEFLWRMARLHSIWVMSLLAIKLTASG
jgi:hypothetical protein